MLFTCSSWSAWSKGRRPLGAVLHSSWELGELIPWQRLTICLLWATTATFKWCPQSMKWLSTTTGETRIPQDPHGSLRIQSLVEFLISLGHFVPPPHIGNSLMGSSWQQQQQQQQQSGLTMAAAAAAAGHIESVISRKPRKNNLLFRRQMSVVIESFEFPGRREAEFLGTKVEAALLTRHETGRGKETSSEKQETSQPVKQLQITKNTMLSPIHTANADATKLFSRIASAVCTWIRN